MSDEFDRGVIRFMADLPQQGPGSDHDTEAVLARVADRLPPRPQVADLGCGTGRSTLVLAEKLQANVVAVDLSTLFCTRLREHAAARGLAAQIDVREGDMADPPVAAQSLDLLWSEGAAYVLGFVEALTRWRALLKPNGFCVVSECTWLTGDRPEPAARFWADAYPDMTTPEGNVERTEAAGYVVESTHVLSLQGWENYYAPMERDVLDGRADHLSPDFAAGLSQELSIWRQSRGSYGYVFYVMRCP